MTPRATVALLNWNGGDFVRPCIESVLAQTERSIEIVVIDNHSTDGSADVIEHLLGPSRVHHNVVRLAENRGICGGLQVALDRAAGEYFFHSRPTTRCCPTGCNGSVISSTMPGPPHTSRPALSH